MARLHQLCLAIVFLTRLPLGRFLPPRDMPLAPAMWAFPLAGGVVGLIAALPLTADGPPMVMAAMSLGLSVWLTGALHEDALADFADAAGGRTVQDRLRIMRDPHVGTYGIMALICTSALRIGALAVVGPAALIASAAGGRMAAVLAAASLIPVRRDGLGRGAGTPDAVVIGVGMGLAALLQIPAGPRALGAVLAGLIATLLVIRQARRRIGGQTGDVLGAASLCCETAMLAAFAWLT